MFAFRNVWWVQFSAKEDTLSLRLCLPFINATLHLSTINQRKDSPSSQQRIRESTLMTQRC